MHTQTTQTLAQLLQLYCSLLFSLLLHLNDASQHQFFRRLAMLSFWQLLDGAEEEEGGGQIAAETEALR